MHDSIKYFFIFTSLFLSADGLSNTEVEDANHRIVIDNDSTDKDKYNDIFEIIWAKPQVVLDNIRSKSSFPSIEEFGLIFPTFNNEPNKEEIYEKQKIIFHKEVKAAPAEDLDISLVSEIGECSSSYCDLSRNENPEIREDLELSLDEILEQTLDSTDAERLENQDNPRLGMTFLATGGLFQEARIISILSKHLRSNLKFDIHLIDPSYSIYMKDTHILDLSLGKAIHQFSKLVYSKFPNARVIVYKSTINYVQNVVDKIAAPSLFIFAIDFGSYEFEFLECLMDLALIRAAAGCEKFIEFRAPHHILLSEAGLYKGLVDHDEKTRFIEIALAYRNERKYNDSVQEVFAASDKLKKGHTLLFEKRPS